MPTQGERAWVTPQSLTPPQQALPKVLRLHIPHSRTCLLPLATRTSWESTKARARLKHDRFKVKSESTRLTHKTHSLVPFCPFLSFKHEGSPGLRKLLCLSDSYRLYVLIVLISINLSEYIFICPCCKKGRWTLQRCRPAASLVQSH